MPEVAGVCSNPRGTRRATLSTGFSTSLKKCGSRSLFSAPIFMSSSESTEQPTVSPAEQPGSPAAAETSASDASAQLAAAKKEAADNYDRYMRIAADLENLRKRTIREKEELRLFASSRVLED